VRTDTLQINVDPVMKAGLMEVCSPADGPETDLYVSLAQELDDGEAMALAIAKSRGWTLATDDRKARRKATELGVRALTTPELMRRWAERTKHPKRVVTDALLRIETLARFIPAGTAPDADWWRAQLKR
jgi:predicted nucleic acid-binding protein